MSAGRDAPSRPLLRWLFEPRSDRGISFAGDRGAWVRWSYADLADHCHDVAAGLIDAGVRPGDTVAVVRRSGPGFVGALFGVMLAGATPCPIAPPMAFQDMAVYEAHLIGLLTQARPALVVTEPELVPTVSELAGRAGAPAVHTVEELTDGPGHRGGDHFPDLGRRPAELALVQFTSGSSGRARGVGVPYEALEGNLAAIQSWLGYSPDDPGASWLPVHHDMGLIGCLLTPIWCRADLWLMRPEQFIQNPLRYLRCFGADGATITAMPNFGLDYIARRVPPEALSGLDFSRWKALIVGAERVHASTLEAFTRLLSPHGLRRETLLPAYGMAEATLVVTGLPPATGWTRACVDAGALTPGSSVAYVTDADAHVLVGCGPPVTGVRVGVVDDAGQPLPDDRVGEIVVTGGSVARGYLNDGASPSLTRLADGVLHSGDVGFQHDGQLYVVGRLGDSVKVRGRALYAEDIEAVLVRNGVPTHRVAAALGIHGGSPTVVVVAEGATALGAGDLPGLLRKRAEGAQVILVEVRRGAIPRTSSGKPKRRQLWRAFVDGSLQAANGGRQAAAVVG